MSSNLERLRNEINNIELPTWVNNSTRLNQTNMNQIVRGIRTVATSVASPSGILSELEIINRDIASLTDSVASLSNITTDTDTRLNELLDSFNEHISDYKNLTSMYRYTETDPRIVNSNTAPFTIDSKTGINMIGPVTLTVSTLKDQNNNEVSNLSKILYDGDTVYIIGEGPAYFAGDEANMK